MRRVLSFLLRVIRDIVMWVSILAALAWIGIFFVPKLFGYYPFVVLSGSMEPTVHVGSLAYVDLFEDGEEPEPDEIHAYRARDGEMVLHRLMGTSDTGYVFKGDANDAYDAITVGDEDIVGRYATSVPYLGYAAAWVQNNSIVIGRIQIPAVVLLMAGAILIVNMLCNIVCREYYDDYDDEVDDDDYDDEEYDDDGYDDEEYDEEDDDSE